jgi:flavin-binding protein dodecin
VGSSGCIREIEDLLARAERVRDVSAAQAAEIAVRNGVELGRRHHTARRALYRRFLEHCLADQSVSAEEAAELAHLRELLQLDESDAIQIHELAVLAIYGSALDRVLKDHRLEPEEEAFLERLRHDLAIAPEAAARLYRDAEARARRRFLDTKVVQESGIVATRGLTLELAGVSEKSIEDAVRSALDEALRAFPRIERAELSEIAAEIGAGGVARWRVTLRARRDQSAV